ncbi:MAG: hypothetical protein KDI36_19670, partial [Pseudomonadales bacterium]|nr:hypothetical protein [Pseudomonadales bacterium]
PDFNLEHQRLTYLKAVAALTATSTDEQGYEQMQAFASQFESDDPSPVARMAHANIMSHFDWHQNEMNRIRIRQAWESFFQQWDFLICPVACTAAFAHDHSPQMTRTLMVNGEPRRYMEGAFWAGLTSLPGLPSTVFPMGLTDAGLPVGLQVVGKHYDDLLTIGCAGLIEKQFGGYQPPPASSG